MRALGKYVLLELPGWFVAALLLLFAVRREWVSQGLAALLFGLWVAKDFALYPVLRVALTDSVSADGADALVGAIGTVTRPFEPTGYVRLGSELWRAETAPEHRPIAVGASVRVRATRGLTLEV